MPEVPIFTGKKLHMVLNSITQKCGKHLYPVSDLILASLLLLIPLLGQPFPL